MSGIGATSFVFEQLGFHDGLILLKDTFHSWNDLVFWSSVTQGVECEGVLLSSLFVSIALTPSASALQNKTVTLQTFYILMCLI